MSYIYRKGYIYILVVTVQVMFGIGKVKWTGCKGKEWKVSQKQNKTGKKSKAGREWVGKVRYEHVWKYLSGGAEGGGRGSDQNGQIRRKGALEHRPEFLNF